MKIQKRFIFLITLITMFIIAPSSIGAAVSVNKGQGTTNDTGGGGGDCGTGSSYCMYNNHGRHTTVKMTLVYYNGSSLNSPYTYTDTESDPDITIQSKPIYITNNNSWGALKELVADDPDAYYDANFNGGSFVYDDGASARIRNYVRTNINTILRRMNVSNLNLNNLDLDTYAASTRCGINCKGYRILIEPVFSYRANSTIYFYTVKQMAKKEVDAGTGTEVVTNPNYFTDIDFIKFNFEFDDIGKRYSTTYNENNVADLNNGLGYLEVDFSDLIVPKKCYEWATKGSSAVCDTTGRNTGTGAYYMRLRKRDCTDEEANNARTYNELKKNGPVYRYGRLYYKGNKYKIYCKESVYQIYPANYSHFIDLVGYGANELIWPASEPNFKPAIYRMSISGILSCHVIKNGNPTRANTSAVINAIKDAANFYKFNAEAYLDWQGVRKNGSNYGENKKLNRYSLGYKYINTTTPWYSNSTTFREGSTIENKIEQLNASNLDGFEFSIQATAKFSLPSNYNRYLDKETAQTFNTPPRTNYIDLGHANLYVPLDAEVDIPQNTIIETTKIGAHGAKGSGVDRTPIFEEKVKRNKYSCYYIAKKFDPPGDNCDDDDCDDDNSACPKDSPNYGKYTYAELMNFKEEHKHSSMDETIQHDCYNICPDDDCDDDNEPSCSCPTGTAYAGKYLGAFDPNSQACYNAQMSECNVCTCDTGDSILNDGEDLTCIAKTTVVKRTKIDDYEGLTSATDIAINNEIKNSTGYDPNLFEKVCNQTKKSFCNKQIDEETITEEYPACVNVYCPAPFDSISITSCINAGKSKEKCYIEAGCYNGCIGYNNATSTQRSQAKDCIKQAVESGRSTLSQATSACNRQYCGNNTTSNIFCPNEPDRSNPSSMTYRFRSCVQTKMAQGQSLDLAKRNCNQFCEPELGNIVIYRVIDLANPFPSYDGDSGGYPSSITVGKYNLNIRGRYPGTNWYDDNGMIVSSKILKNRGVTADEVYNKTPLYTFKLNGNTIKTIRQYNNNQKQHADSYNDFTLTCKQNNNRACISGFVHNTAYGLTGGTCAGANDEASFNNCLTQ